MRRLAIAGVVVCLGSGALIDARQPRPGATGDLPIRRVVLYKSGIGFFEHVGRVTGDQRVEVPFTSPQLDDVLKTLTVLDLDGGVVSTVGYTSEAPIGRRLSALGLPIGEDTTLPEFLSALRGARVEVRRGAAAVTGRLLDVESRGRVRDGGAEQVDQISIVTAGGDVHAFDLGAGTVVRFADAALNERVNRYLELVASSRDQDRRTLTIATTGRGTRRLYVSYVSEVPVWKTTYRIVMPDDAAAKPLLQGWAIVDNTVGDDWTDVELSLVAGAPQSFVQPISQPLYTRRPQVPMPSGFLLSPQAHAATLVATDGAGGVVVDASGAVLPGVTVRVRDAGGQVVGTATTDGAGRFSIPGVSGRLRADFTLTGFNSTALEFDAGIEQRVVMSVGAMTETVTVESKSLADARGAAGGRPRPAPGGRVGGNLGGVPAAPPSVFRSAVGVPAQATGRDLGELFEYALEQRVTVRQNQSAMVPIISAPVGAERVSLWSRAEASSRPRRAVWITNSSGLTLDGGSMTILDRNTFAGEGLVETVKPGERRLVSYAADLGMQVDASHESTPGRQQRVRIARGMMTVETFECDRTRYTARNQDTTPRQLVIEHPRRDGWQLQPGGPSPAESTAGAHRFQVAVAPSTTADLVVAGYRPIQTTVQVGNLTDDQLQLYTRQGALDEKTRAALAEIAEAKQAMRAVADQLAARSEEVSRITQDQQRVRENMKSLKGSSEEKQLLARYVRQLDEQEDRLGVLRRETADLQRQMQERTEALNLKIVGLSAEPGPLAAPCVG